MPWCYIIHPGHIDHFKFFQKIKERLLVISVTSDQFVNKGFGRPIFDVNKRKLFLSNFGSFVDIVVESDNKSAVSIIKKNLNLIFTQKDQITKYQRMI